MSFSKIAVNKDTWTLIGNNVSSITFQNIGQFPAYVNFSANTSPPVASVGLVYDMYQKELKKTVTDMTYLSTPNYVWAKAVSASTSFAVETSA